MARPRSRRRRFIATGRLFRWCLPCLFAVALPACQKSPQTQGSNGAPSAAPTARVHGRLVVNGEPMGGLRVTLLHEPWVGTPPKTQTGADGSFDFGTVQAGEIWLMFTTADGSASFTKTENMKVAADEDRNVEVAREAGSIRGTLTGELGDPATLRVLLTCDPNSDAGDVGRLRIAVPSRSMTPDSNGSFAIGPLVTGRYTLEVERHLENIQLRRFVSDSVTSVAVTKGDATAIEPIELLPEVTVSGRFELPADKRLAKLIVDHGVWFARPYGAGRTGATARLAPDHTFTLHLVPATYSLGSLGVDDDPHAESDPLVVPREGLKNVVIKLRKSGE